MTREQIEAIIKGCEGVTSGPWRHYRNRLRPTMGGIINEVQSASLPPVVKWAGFDDSDRTEKRHALNAAHIARLDPDTVRALCRLALIGMDAEARLSSAYQACGALTLTLPADDPEVIALLDMLSDPAKPIPDAPWTLAAKLRVIENIDAVKSAAYHRGAADMRERAAAEAYDRDISRPDDDFQRGYGIAACDIVAAIRAVPFEGEQK